MSVEPIFSGSLGATDWAEPSSGHGRRTTGRAFKRTVVRGATAEGSGATAGVVVVHGRIGEARLSPRGTIVIVIVAVAEAVSSVPIQLG